MSSLENIPITYRMNAMVWEVGRAKSLDQWGNSRSKSYSSLCLWWETVAHFQQCWYWTIWVHSMMDFEVFRFRSWTAIIQVHVPGSLQLGDEVHRIIFRKTKASLNISRMIKKIRGTSVWTWQKKSFTLLARTSFRLGALFHSVTNNFLGKWVQSNLVFFLSVFNIIPKLSKRKFE